MTNRSQKCGQRTAICHFSLVICHLPNFPPRTLHLYGEILVAAMPRQVCLSSSVVSFILSLHERYSESSPRSPVRTRTESSSGSTKILPSPISPVYADFRIAWTTSSH